MITTIGLAEELAGHGDLGIDVDLGDKTKAFLADAGAKAKTVLLVAGGVLVGATLLGAYVNWPRARSR